MYRVLLYLILASASLLTSCEKKTNELEANEYLIFGDYYGFCTGKCTNIYKLQKDGLLMDTIRYYPPIHEFYNGSYISMPEKAYKQTRNLIDYFPTTLLNEKQIIGIPDAYDQGGYYVEYNAGGVKKSWFIDKDIQNVPQQYHKFVNTLNEKIINLK